MGPKRLAVACIYTNLVSVQMCLRHILTCKKAIQWMLSRRKFLAVNSVNTPSQFTTLPIQTGELRALRGGSLHVNTRNRKVWIVTSETGSSRYIFANRQFIVVWQEFDRMDLFLSLVCNARLSCVWCWRRDKYSEMHASNSLIRNRCLLTWCIYTYLQQEIFSVRK